MRRVVHALGVLLMVCIGVRLAAWLIEPVFAPLGALVVLAAVGWIVLKSRKGRSW